jgi:hypothetical protein
MYYPEKRATKMMEVVGYEKGQGEKFCFVQKNVTGIK